MRHEQAHVPVTALAFWKDDVVLAGEGNYLTIYDVRRRCLLATKCVFDDHSVHGIVVDSHTDGSVGLIWGGRFLRSIRLHYSQQDAVHLTMGAVQSADDWILHAAFCPATGLTPRAALVTAHNSMLLCNWLDDLSRVAVQVLVPGTKCMLYSAQVTWLSGSDCLIASGTAFGDVLIWSCSTNGEESAANVETHYTFAAHEGSIFGLHLSDRDEAAAMGHRRRVLATCSDDRTICLWDISDLTRTGLGMSDVQPHTGFGAKPAMDLRRPPLLAKTMGHQSRIWHIRFVRHLVQRNDRQPSAERAQVCVQSFGEDAIQITWALLVGAATPGATPYTLKQLRSQRMHNGKNIWSAAVSPKALIATGGADGGLSFASCYGQEESMHVFEVDHTAGQYKIVAYEFVECGKLITTTQCGKVCALTLQADGRSSFRVLSDAIAGLQGYSTMCSASGHTFLAGGDGKIYLHTSRPDGVHQIAETGSKVAGLFAQATSIADAETSIGLLVTNVGQETAHVFRLPRKPCQEPSDLVSESFEVPLSRNFVVTSFAYCLIRDRELIMLGSRTGRAAIYSVQRQSETRATCVQTSLCPGVHGKETVTALHVAARELNGSAGEVLFSTGRDGTFTAHELNFGDHTIQLRTVHQLSLPLGPNIEGHGVSIQGHVWVWGFRGKEFVVFNINTQQEIMTVECGGAHRTWAFQMSDNGGTFVWTQGSKVYYQSRSEPQVQTINSGGHGREIKTAAFSPGPLPLVATGAEDTDIKLWIDHEGDLRCVNTLRKHITGVQDLQWSPDGSYLFSSGGFEEFLVWRIQRSLPYIGTGVICESEHPNSGTSDLRIMSFCILGHGETNASDSNYTISMVYSDSTTRVWNYQYLQWTLLAQGDYLTACLAQCSLLDEPSNWLVTGGTDGFLAIWDTKIKQRTVSWSVRQRVHQHSLLCMAVHHLKDGSSLVISGGDDNAIGVTRIDPSDTTKTLLVKRAHAAAVTALAIVDHTVDQLRFVSSSNDQRVKLWRLHIDEEQPGVEGIRIECIADEFTAVADVSSAVRIRCPQGKNRILVAGVGFDVWEIEGNMC